MLISHFNPLLRYKKVLKARVSPIIIKEGVILAVKSVVLPGVTIGENSIISAGSVVCDDIEPYSLARGNPAKKIGRVKL
jgi:acetyltransferase-like isoleucine patch superfamily enzyme